MRARCPTLLWVLMAEENPICECCEEKNEVIVALQHVIRELRHDLVIAQIEVKVLNGSKLFALEKAA
jgi:hypothetical protein